jgi:dihydrolipoamide dehydrogenase
MSQTIEVKVPDIGDFKDVEVIEVLVKPGDTVAKEQSLVTVESDKASMEIPSAAAGRIKELKVKLGDKVSEGSLLALLETSAESAAATRPGARGSSCTCTCASTCPAPASAPRPPAADFGGKADIECEVLVLGAGPGGYSAAFRAADLGMKTVLVERYGTLGGVCLNVGCIPSKALLHVAAVLDEAAHFSGLGVEFGKPKIALDKLRAHKDEVVGKLTGGLMSMAKMRKVTVVRGVGQFVGSHHLEVELTSGDAQQKTGEKKVVRFDRAIIAAGSQAVRLPFVPDHPRIVDSTGALDLERVPKRMLVIGGGIIGLEMATVYAALGARIEVVEMLDGLMTGADRDLVKVWQKFNDKRFDKVMLKTKTVAVEAAETCCASPSKANRRRPNRRITTTCWSRSAVRPMVARSAPRRRVSQ